MKYKISDNTDISNIPLKQFISHVETKHELTVYLSKLVQLEFEEINLAYTITFDRQCESNFVDKFSHDHEEADTLLILQALNVAKVAPFIECVIYSPDTDVFLLAIHYYPSLPQVTALKELNFTGNKSRG